MQAPSTSRIPALWRPGNAIVGLPRRKPTALKAPATALKRNKVPIDMALFGSVGSHTASFGQHRFSASLLRAAVLMVARCAARGFLSFPVSDTGGVLQEPDHPRVI